MSNTKFGKFLKSDNFGSTLNLASGLADQAFSGSRTEVGSFVNPSPNKKGVVNLDTEYDKELNVSGGKEIAGSVAKGALSGAAAGAAFTPIGAAIGAVVGGAVSFFTSKRKQKKEQEAEDERKRLQLEAKQDALDTQMPEIRAQAFNEVVNAPINPIEAGFAYGGYMGNNEEGEINSTDITEFNTGGLHETNPNGGIPQGVGPNGKINKVEEEEVKIKTGKGSAYVFSNRLIFE